MSIALRDEVTRLSPVLYFREFAGLTQRELAALTKDSSSKVFDDLPKWSEQYIRRLEKGMASSTPDTLLYVGDVLSRSLGSEFQYARYKWVARISHMAVELDCRRVLPVEAYDPNGNFWQDAYDSWVTLKTLCYRPIYDRKAVYKEAKDLRNAWCRAIGINESRYALSEAWSINVASLARWEAVCGPRTAPSDRHDPRWPSALVDRLTLLELADSSLSGGAA